MKNAFILFRFLKKKLHKKNSKVTIQLMSENRTDISVIISTYNGERFLRESINSIIAQTFRNIEIIIINDGSNDETASILEEFQKKDSRITVITNTSSRKLPAALNQGLDIAKGKYIARHDDDDVAVPDRLQIQWDYMESHPDIFLCGGQGIVLSEDGKLQNIMLRETDFSAIKERLSTDFVNELIHPTIFFRNTGEIRYREKFTNSQDMDLYLRLLTDGKTIVNLPYVLVFYRSTPNQKGRVKKLIRQGMFFKKIHSQFYQERLMTGCDSYEATDFSIADNLKWENSESASFLKTMTQTFFWRKEYSSCRLAYRKYINITNKSNPKLLLYYILSFIPGGHGVGSFLKLFLKNSTSIYPKLVLLSTTGNGLMTWEKIGTTDREFGIYHRMATHGWTTDFYSYDRLIPERYRKGCIRIIRPFINLPTRFRKWYGVLIPYIYKMHGGNAAYCAVITNQAHSAMPGVKIKKRGGRLIARCGYVRGRGAELSHAPQKEQELIRKEESTVFRNADCCFIPTEEMKDWVVSNYKIDKNRILIIPNYINTSLFSPSDCEKKENSVLCVGRLAEVKNYKLLIDACAGTNYRITIIGGGSSDELKEYAQKRKTNVDFISRVDNHSLPSYYRQTSIFVICSNYEGHPKSLAEAMSCGCACIGTNRPGIRNQIKDHKTGLCVEPTSDDLRKAIQELSGNPSLREYLGKNARTYAVESFELSKIALRYEESIINVLLKDKNGRK